jgi:hypothetical protein
VKSLSEKAMDIASDQRPISVGMAPDTLLRNTPKTAMSAIKPICVGKVPSMGPVIKKTHMLVKSPSSDGSVPENQLLYNARYVSAVS